MVTHLEIILKILIMVPSRYRILDGTPAVRTDINWYVSFIDNRTQIIERRALFKFENSQKDRVAFSWPILMSDKC